MHIHMHKDKVHNVCDVCLERADLPGADGVGHGVGQGIEKGESRNTDVAFGCYIEARAICQLVVSARVSCELRVGIRTRCEQQKKSTSAHRVSTDIWRQS